MSVFAELWNQNKIIEDACNRNGGVEEQNGALEGL